jgi:uncharacterized protein YaiI (UPF0178 family)
LQQLREPQGQRTYPEATKHPELKGLSLVKIYVDADSSPVKNEVIKVAKRYGLTVYLVSNSEIQIGQDESVEMVIVSGNFDAADDWIAERVTDQDIVASGDIPLASRCLEKGARVIDPKGRIFTVESIGEALANRQLMAYLRDMGNITRGAAPYAKQDRSRFLQRLDDLIQAAFKEQR